jgi:hypothetical protein
MGGLDEGMGRGCGGAGPSERRALFNRLVAIACAGFIVLGCGDSVSGPEDSNSLPGLVGQWEWVSSCGGISGGCITPQSSNATQTWVFTSENLFQWFQSGSLVLAGAYEIVEGELNILNRRADFLWVDGTSTGLALELTDTNTLIARADCYDCYTDTWIRQPT